MQHPRVGILFGGLTFLTICCVLVGVFWDGYYLPNKPCRPLTYPNGQRSGAPFFHDTLTPLESVLQFYDQQLEVGPFPADTGQWRREKLGDFKYLYSCFGVDINGLTGETGCIYVSGDRERTHIEAKLLRGEGGSPACPVK